MQTAGYLNSGSWMPIRQLQLSAFVTCFLVLAAATTGRAQTHDQRVGLVLSGGAARGFAHVGVIEVLEEHGLQVDVVTGTSMGSIVGGMYAMGYTPAMLRDVSSRLDWARVFSDQPERRNLPIERKPEDGRVVFSLPMNGVVPTLPSSIIEGQRISQLLSGLTWPAHSTTDFADLPRPFGAVATAVDSGQAISLRGGYLPEAIRASLAIPGVFAPVEIDDRLLIDGGVARNLPAQDARDLGANWIICSDVSLPLESQDSLKTFAAILNQTVAFRMWERTLEQRKLCDVLIVISVPSSMSSAFDRAEEIIEYGRASAEAALDSLRVAGVQIAPAAAFRAHSDSSWDPLAEQARISAIRVDGIEKQSLSTVLRTLQLDIGSVVSPADVDEAISRLYDSGLYRNVWYRLETRPPAALPGDTTAVAPATDTPEVVLALDVREKKQNKLGASYRYDGRYKASILATANFRNLLVPGSFLRADLRLGEQGRFVVDFGKRWGWSVAPMLALRFDNRRMPFDIFVDGERVSEPRVRSTSMRGLAGFGLGYDAFIGLEFGYEDVNSEPAPLADDWTAGDQDFATLAGLVAIDRWDRARFQRRGWQLLAKGLWADESIGGSTFSQYVLDVQGVIPVAGRIGILGRATIGTTDGEDLPSNYLFFAGGSQQYQMYRDRQFPFFGLRVNERRGRHLQSGMLGLQWEFLPDLFVQARGNAAALPEEWEWDEAAFFGGWGLTLGAWTRFGSGALTVAGENFSEWPRVEIDVGFPF